MFAEQSFGDACKVDALSPGRYSGKTGSNLRVITIVAHHLLPVSYHGKKLTHRVAAYVG